MHSLFSTTVWYSGIGCLVPFLVDCSQIACIDCHLLSLKPQQAQQRTPTPRHHIMRLSEWSRILVALVLVTSTTCQRYADYEDEGGDYGYQDYGGGGDGDYGADDTLYQDYAQRQETKEVGAGTGGGGGLTTVLVGIGSYFLGAKVHASRAQKKLKKRHQNEQKQLYAQYYNDVYKLSDQNSMLAQQIEDLKDALRNTEAKAEYEKLQRDYDEFKQPDLDGDDKISRAEFNMYVKNYLANYPGLTEKDYPVFDDFDHDGDGYVSFQEYAQQMALQTQQAELEQMYSGGSDQKAQAYKDMYQGSTGNRY